MKIRLAVGWRDALSVVEMFSPPTTVIPTGMLKTKPACRWMERRSERFRTILAANQHDTFHIHIRPPAVVGVLTNNHENLRWRWGHQASGKKRSAVGWRGVVSLVELFAPATMGIATRNLHWNYDGYSKLKLL